MAAEQNFRVNVDNFLSFEHDEYKNSCYSLAISDPKAYYDLRSKVHALVKRAALKDLYKTFYDVLDSGEVNGDTAIATTVTKQPKYPAQKASDFALDACATMMPVIERVIDILLPMNGTETAQKRLAEVSLGKN
jgi:hypothetical protein